MVVEVVDACRCVWVGICVKNHLVLEEVLVSARWSKGSLLRVLHQLGWSHWGSGCAHVFHRVYGRCLTASNDVGGSTLMRCAEVVRLAVHSDEDDLLLSRACLFSLFGKHVCILFIEVFALYPFDIFRLKNMSFLLLFGL